MTNLSSLLSRGFLLALVTGAIACAPTDPLPVGVLMPTSTERGRSLVQSMRWAVETVNAAGGVRGRPLSLVVEDTGDDVHAAAARLVATPGLTAVLGPESSAAVFDVAAALLDAGVPFVTPSATSGDFFRAFAGNPLAWRTVESDIGQARALLTIARRGGASTVAFLGSEDHYGGTFFNWFGFLSASVGLRPVGIVSSGPSPQPDCAALVTEVLATQPDVVLAVPSDTPTAVCFARELSARRGRTRVLFSDTGWDEAVLTALGAQAEGLEGAVGVSAPESGFADAWRARWSSEPPAYASHAWDAVLLVAYGLVRAEGRGGLALGSAMGEVASSRGRPVGSDAAGIRDALAAFARGEAIDATGAAGALDFDHRFATDVVAGTWGHWTVRGGRYEVGERLSSAEREAAVDSSIYQSFAPPLASLSSGGPVVGARTGLNALVVATSKGWDNYRHQADALAVADVLRRAGLGEGELVLVVADDLAADPRNAAPGTVRFSPGGPDLRATTPKTHALGALTTGDLWALVRGETTARAPRGLSLSPSEDLVIYLSGHGAVRGLDWAGDPGDRGVLLPSDLADALWAAKDRYRRALVVVESCLAGVMADALVARGVPRVLVLTSSDRTGGSFASHYDPFLETWLSDQFTEQLVRGLEAAPRSSLLDTVRDLYTRVPGSYVSVWNAERFGVLEQISTRDFFAP